MINGNEILDLMFESMTDDKMIEMIDKLGMEQPQITEEYEEDRYIIIDNEEMGIILMFEEIDGCSDGIPKLVKIDILHTKNISLPLGLSENDDYEKCCELFGKKADYYKKNFEKTFYWMSIPLKNNSCQYVISFNDDNLCGINNGLLIIYSDYITRRMIKNDKY